MQSDLSLKINLLAYVIKKHCFLLFCCQRHVAVLCLSIFTSTFSTKSVSTMKDLDLNLMIDLADPRFFGGSLHAGTGLKFECPKIFLNPLPSPCFTMVHPEIMEFTPSDLFFFQGAIFKVNHFKIWESNQVISYYILPPLW